VVDLQERGVWVCGPVYQFHSGGKARSETLGK
jgi:hypothetical protein